MPVIMIGNLIDPDDERDNPPHERGLHVIVTRLRDDLIVLDDYVEPSRTMDRDLDRLLDYVAAETTARDAGPGRYRVDIVNDGRNWPPLDAFVIFEEPMGDDGVWYAWERDAARRYWVLPDTVPAVRPWPAWALSDHPTPIDEPDIDAAFDASSFGPSNPRLERYLASREQAREARTNAVVEAVLAVADQIKALREEDRQRHVDAMQHMTWCAEEAIVPGVTSIVDAAATVLSEHVDEGARDVVNAVAETMPRRARIEYQARETMRIAHDADARARRESITKD